MLPGFEPGTFCVLGRCDNHYTTAPLIIYSRLTLIDCLVVMLSGNGSGSCQQKTSVHASVAQSAARQSHNESKCKSDLKVVSSSLTRGKIFIFRLFFHDSVIKKYPSNRIRTSDLRMSALHSPLQSSALPTELSRDDADARQQKKLKFIILEKKDDSSGWFRSIDLWVMGPARFHCATLLLMSSRYENQYHAKIRDLHDKWKICWKRKMSAQ